MEVWTSSNTAEMSIIYIWIGLASIVGPMLIGPQFDRINDMLLLSLCLVMVGVFMALAPIGRSLFAFQAIIALMILFYSGLLSGELLILSDQLVCNYLSRIEKRFFHRKLIFH